ncbi:MAG: hypothetical protein HC822_07905 [Oscillochloris sp.]|nr:hypothetical protein [Oscillochloris sp.]
MCKRSYHRPVVADGSYEGETMHLSSQEGRRCGWGHFPWWTLWLIWPAIWLFKGLGLVLAPLIVGAAFWQLLLAVVLIGAGVALVLADRMRQ